MSTKVRTARLLNARDDGRVPAGGGVSNGAPVLKSKVGLPRKRNAGAAAAIPVSNGDIETAVRRLGEDARLAPVIERVGACAMQTIRDPYVALLCSIIHQQLSMSAARTIRGRVKALCPRGRISPAAIDAVPTARLRAAGLSRQKVDYIRDLTRHFLSGRITLRGLRRMTDEQVIETVTEVRGIGRWTAEMLLIFCLGRPDVWPVDDLGLQKAVHKLLARRRPLSRDKLEKAGDAWRPHRSYATWYLWRSLEGPVTPGLNP